eukprot:comp17898_c0_seq1/m.18144 comp17898_c0_seq1/g.18144  ORF comp17898_c0_seq1/g.18144 comp17898_c0_seq1/m.18144 type:complete len:425 (-) comp17898_c0_seq1:14-1288(-)
MDKIKAFFDKKKADSKFVGAGKGTKLSEEAPKPKAPPPKPQAQRQEPSQASSAAAQAALARFETKNAPKPKPVPKPAPTDSTTQAFSGAGQDLKATSSGTVRKPSTDSNQAGPSTDAALKPAPAAKDQPIVQPEIPLNPNDPTFIRTLEEDPIALSVYFVTISNEPEAYKTAFGLIERYIDNILKNPTEPKYRKIKVGNKVFQEKVFPVVGHDGVLEACGFIQTTEQEPVDGKDAAYFVLPEGVELSLLEVVKATMQNPPKPPIDRCVKVFEPSTAPSQHWHLPDTFYVLTREDIAARQEELKSTADKETTLRTKAMREAEKTKPKAYRLACIRIRLPDGVMLQGHFRVHEPMSRVIDFVKHSLVDPSTPFRLTSHPDRVQLDANPAATMTDLGLVPTALINLLWDGPEGVLLPELLEQKQPLT